MSDVAVARFNISTLSVQILLLSIFSELISGTQRTPDMGDLAIDKPWMKI